MTTPTPTGPMWEMPIVPWWKIMKLRPEVIAADGVIKDVRMSLHNAAFGAKGTGAGRVPYADPVHYGEITHPAGSLVDFMARVAVRLGVPGSTQTRAVWRLDQAMGGGKSHGLIGLWHLAQHPEQLSGTDLGRQVMAAADDIAGQGKTRPDLGNPVCVVLDCDNTSASDEDFGPANLLGERFLWRLFNTDYGLYNTYKEHTANKAKLSEALRAVGRPVLVLIDEIMDYMRVVAAKDQEQAALDMAFVRALLDAVNDIPNCVVVVAMIASEKDNMAMTGFGKEVRREMEDLLTRDARTTAVTSGGDFAEIIQRRLFSDLPPREITDSISQVYFHAMSQVWSNRVFSKLSGVYSAHEFPNRVARSYPFHPDLIALAEDEWSTHAGFQKVRSTISVFALAAFEQARRASEGEWVPHLIDSGDLPLGFPPLRDALIDSGLVADDRTRSNLREVATVDIVDPHNPDRGTARRLDETRDLNEGWIEYNPYASERMATALFVKSLCPRVGGTRGASELELLASSFVPVGAYGPGDAEIVAAALLESNKGLASVDFTPGKGRAVPKRWFFETRKTLEMLTRAEKKTITDRDRDRAITDRAFELAQKHKGPFDKIVLVDGDDVPSEGVTLQGCRRVLQEELGDSRHTRLAILDSRWFSLFNGDDSTTRQSVTAALGVGHDRMPSEWASSIILACANTALRAQARGLASEWLARRRVAELRNVETDPQMRDKAREQERRAKNELDKKVRLCYKHIIYLAPKEEHDRDVNFIRVAKDTRTALSGADVWSELRDYSKAFRHGEFTGDALAHNLRPNDYGLPISELRDNFWSNPHKALLPGGEKELSVAIYQAVKSGHIELVNPEGDAYQVHQPNDINLDLPSVRLRRATCATCDKPASQCQGHPLCATCGSSASDCNCAARPQPATPTPDTPKPVPPPPQWQASFNIAATLGDDDTTGNLIFLLREILDSMDDGNIKHINQSMQITLADDEVSRATLDALKSQASKANAAMTVRKI